MDDNKNLLKQKKRGRKPLTIFDKTEFISKLPPEVVSYDYTSGVATLENGSKAQIMKTESGKLQYKLLADLRPFAKNTPELRKMFEGLLPDASLPQTDGLINKVLNSPEMRDRSKDSTGNAVEKAQEILQNAIVAAAENYANAVKNQDMAASKDILQYVAKLFVKEEKRTNVNVSFTDYLREELTFEDKEALEIPFSIDEDEDDNMEEK